MSSHEISKSNDNVITKQNETSITSCGTAVFFNCIEDCKNDVFNLKKRLENLGWVCIEVEINSMKDFQNKEIKISSGIMMVFFFGYGYEDQMFLGTSTKESVSDWLFFQKMNEIQKESFDDNNKVVIFTNLYFKNPVDDTYEYVELEEHPRNIYHFHIIEINGTCEKTGSLLTHILLNDMEKKDLPFGDMAEKLTGKIKAFDKCNKGKYYSYWGACATSKSVIIPSLC